MNLRFRFVARTTARFTIAATNVLGETSCTLTRSQLRNSSGVKRADYGSSVAVGAPPLEAHSFADQVGLSSGRQSPPMMTVRQNGAPECSRT